jgi:LEA14-like dessication related protein
MIHYSGTLLAIAVADINRRLKLITTYTSLSSVKIFRPIIMIMLLAALATAMYGWYNYKQPTLSYGNKFELVEFTDTNCRVNIAVRIKNENFFSIHAKDVVADIGHGSRGTLDNGTIKLPGFSDSIYTLAVSMRFSSVNHLLHQLTGGDNQGVKKAVTLKTRIGFIPYYFPLDIPLLDSGKHDLKQLFTRLLNNNITISKIYHPDTAATTASHIGIDLKVKNPFPVPLKIKNYTLTIYEPGDSSAILAEIQNLNSILLQPQTERTVNNSLSVQPGANIVEFLKGFVTNHTYNFHITALVGVDKFEFPLSYAFSYRMF